MSVCLSLLNLIWLKGIVEQTMCRGAQIYTDLSAFFLYQNPFYHVSDFLAMEGRGAHCGGLVLVH